MNPACRALFATLLCSLFVLANAAATTTYRLTDLGDLADHSDPAVGFPSSYGRRLNALGHVAGETGHPVSGTTTFLWTPEGGMQGSGLQHHGVGHFWEFLLALNDSDVVVGYQLATTTPAPLIWSPSAGLRDLQQVTGVQNIRTVGGINAAHAIVGTVDDGGTLRPFVWREGQTLQLLSPPFPVESAERINANGQFIGSVSGSPDQAYRWDPQAGFELLGDFPGGSDYSGAYAQNQAGHMVGSNGAASGAQRAFLWTEEDGLQGLGELTGLGPASYWALGINELDHIAGGAIANDGTYHAFIWTPDDAMVDLQTLIDPGDPLYGEVELHTAYDINDAGQIVALGELYGYFTRAFLLTPVTAEAVASPVTVPFPRWGQGLLIALVAYVSTRRNALRARDRDGPR